MGRLRLEPKEEQLHFVALKLGGPSTLPECKSEIKRNGPAILVKCGPFSIEINGPFDARLLSEVLRVVGGCRC